MRSQCPECGQPVKQENLATHLGRVHPRVPRSKYGNLHVPKPRRTGPRLAGWIPVAAVVLAVTVLAGAFFVSSGGGPGPKFYADHLTYDFGHVEQTTHDHSFPIENRGESDLRVFELSSSCDCTSAHVVIGGVAGPHFSMHDKPDWVGVIPPWTSATLVVLYDAVQMPDLYTGPRAVYLRTNDPGNPEVTFTVQVHEPPP